MPFNKYPDSNTTTQREKVAGDYDALTPDFVLDAVESLGYVSDLRVLALNSYENRVYQIGIEEAAPVIAKFYRPNRWSDQQIIEEHHFSRQLHDLEIPVIPPMINADGETLFHYQGHRFALYERKGGQAPDLGDLDNLYTLGQHIGRIHARGASEDFHHRPEINVDTFGTQSRSFILTSNMVPENLRAAYSSISEQLLEVIHEHFSRVAYPRIRLHGDCHPGNILQRPDSMYLVDLDDARKGPAIQDLWMMLSGDTASRRTQLSSIAEGYEEFYELDYGQFALIEPLRTLRLMYYAAWLARRWDDPAFPPAFPWFNTERYWAEHILELKEQMSALQEPVLKISP